MTHIKLSLTALVAAGLALATGCSQPRIITQITGSGDQVKFIYVQQKILRSETGLVQCDRGADGSLSNCKEIEIIFNEAKKGK